MGTHTREHEQMVDQHALDPESREQREVAEELEYTRGSTRRLAMARARWAIGQLQRGARASARMLWDAACRWIR